MGENSNSNVSNHLLEVADKYNLAHKHLVQLIIRHGILQVRHSTSARNSFTTPKFIYLESYDPFLYFSKGSTITQPDDGQEKILLEKLLIAINSALIPLSLRLVQADDEYDDENSYIVLLSDRRPNDLLRNAFGLTLNDFTLFHLWIDAICNSENGEISKYDALAIASSLLTKVWFIQLFL
uniref:Uncharacterized protein n=1 Tax=Setaria digitata TaxID=48799 RepID=A0A915PV09_9BILA